MIEVNKSMLSTATKICNDELSFNIAQFRDLLKIVLQAIRQTQRSHSANLLEIWDVDAWNDLAERIARSSRFQQSTALKKLVAQVVRTIKPAEVNGSNKKRKVDAVGEDTDSRKKKQKRKKEANAES
jgi:predicted nucleotide-binding protein (sugar kinase/HSP70/actin superfamily)